MLICVLSGAMAAPEKHPEPMPEPSAELMLLGAMNRAFLRRLPKKERMAYLQDVTDALDELALKRNIHRIRPTGADEKVRAASDAAQEWWRRALAVLIAGLD
jgi:hypothetical protein